MSDLYEKATPRPWRFVPWHVEEGAPVCRAPAGHICGTFASDADAKMVAHAVNNIERVEALNVELLKALEDFDNWFAGFNPDDRTSRFEGRVVVIQARAAIAKAHGQ